MRRIARLLYYFALAQKSDVVMLSVACISKVALIDHNETRSNMYRMGSMMGEGCKCRVITAGLEITFSTGAPNRVKHVFEYWVKKHGKRNSTKLTSDRRRKVQARLNDGYTVQDMKRGIDGILCSVFHVDNGYTDLTHVCAGGAKLDRFMSLANKRKIVRGKGILGHMHKVTS